MKTFSILRFIVFELLAIYEINILIVLWIVCVHICSLMYKNTKWADLHFDIDSIFHCNKKWCNSDFPYKDQIAFFELVIIVFVFSWKFFRSCNDLLKTSHRKMKIKAISPNIWPWWWAMFFRKCEFVSQVKSLNSISYGPCYMDILTAV